MCALIVCLVYFSVWSVVIRALLCVLCTFVHFMFFGALYVPRNLETGTSQ